jgi:hypothetical protein
MATGLSKDSGVSYILYATIPVEHPFEWGIIIPSTTVGIISGLFIKHDVVQH